MFFPKNLNRFQPRQERSEAQGREKGRTEKEITSTW
jgi:hypothetical protein